MGAKGQCHSLTFAKNHLEFKIKSCFSKKLLVLTFLWQGQVWENAITLNFMESFEGFGQKISTYCCLNEYMNTFKYRRSVSFFEL